jgi:predicted amidohydrolase
MSTLRVAAIQMRARLADVEWNLQSAERLVQEAFRKGAEWVILPEFFPSAVGFHRKMLDVAEPFEGRPMEMVKRFASENQGVVGGSFIAARGLESYNTFVLAFPDGSTHLHDKDQPTMWENCYYLGGNDDGILDTPACRTGAALCWEFVRTRTVRRMVGRVDLVVGGSCWWTLPEKRLPGFPSELRDRNLQIMAATPGRFARLLGVPVVHAAHAGEFEGGLPLAPGFPYRSYYLGETQIVDGAGRILARMQREDGEGFVTAEIDLTGKQGPAEPLAEGFWIPNLPSAFRLIWAVQNFHGRRYYRKKTFPYRKRKLEST